MAEGRVEVDCYKEEFKRFKKRSTDLKDVIDFRNPDNIKIEVERTTSQTKCIESYNQSAELLSLRPPLEWKIFSIPTIPGILILPDLFKEGGQHYWVTRCLVDYPCKPNICNLDAYEKRRGDGCLWPYTQSSSSSSSSSSSCKSEHLLPPKAKKVKVSSHTGESHSPQITKKSSLYRLRWVTLGYHYDWNTKEYSIGARSPFPPDLSKLSSFILDHAGFPGFNAEAAIVNYYHLDSCLSGHTDHSEKDLTQPLLSISFGQAAIFLVGGKNKQVRPTPILLNSGDAVIMSGDARLAYHGVPRILPPSDENKVPPCLSASSIKHGLCHFNLTDEIGVGTERDSRTRSGDCPHCSELESMWPHFIAYLAISRINMNIRQVVSDKHQF